MSQSGRFIATKMVELSMQHFLLSCTTVTGIPMKVRPITSKCHRVKSVLVHSIRPGLNFVKDCVYWKGGNCN